MRTTFCLTNYKILLTLVSSVLIFSDLMGEKYDVPSEDTITVLASTIASKTLIPGTHRYFIYYKLGENSTRKLHELWSRRIALISYEGREAISITQEWENNDTVFHKANSVLDKKTFATLHHENWWKGRGDMSFNFVNHKVLKNKMDLKVKTDSTSVKQVLAFSAACEQHFLNWHLDLEVFSLLLLKEGRTFKINFYDPGSINLPNYQLYSIVGTGILTGYNSQNIECWLLTHGALPYNKEVFWISKKTGEVLKLEQQFQESYRYKIKLGFSD